MKIEITPNKTAHSQEKRNHEPDQDFHPLAEAWSQHRHNLGNDNLRDILAEELNKILLRYLPDRNFGGSLAGCSAEIRQDTLFLLVHKRYLEGNSLLIKATLAGDSISILNQLERTIRAASKFARDRIATDRKKHFDRFATLENLSNRQEHGRNHPALETNFWNLPTETRLEILCNALRSAVHKRLLPRGAAGITYLMMKRGWTQADMARRLNITRSAVSQRLSPVKRYLHKYVQNVEFPITSPLH